VHINLLAAVLSSKRKYRLVAGIVDLVKDSNTVNTALSWGCGIAMI